jgi:hypothetical protein
MTTLRKKVPTFITIIELYGQESRKTSFVGFYSQEWDLMARVQ